MKSDQNQGRKGLAEWIAILILKAQGKWTKGMQKITSRLSTRALKVYIVTITILATCYSGFIIYSALWQADNVFPKIESIQKPLMPVGRNEYKRRGDTLTQQRLKKFHQYLNSLGRSESGRKERDSFLRHRPGLMDSLQRLEELLR